MRPAETTDAQSPGPTSRLVLWTAWLLVPLVLVLLLVLAAEAFVRVRQWTKLGTTSSFSDLYYTDEAIGLRVLRPSTRIGNVTVNSAGFRGPELLVPKPAGQVRLAFLGASTTFCAEASSDAVVWPHQVVDQLRRRFPDVRFDFVNGSVPGHTLDSTRKLLARRIAALQPDLIVIYPGTNDLSGEVRDKAVAAGLAEPHDPSNSHWLQRNMLLWGLVEKNLLVLAAQRSATQSDSSRLKVDAPSLGAEFDKNLRGLLHDAGADAQRVAIATFSTQLRRDQTAEQKQRASMSAFVYMPFMTIDGLLAGYARHNELIAKAALVEGALLIGGEDGIPGDQAHFVDTVHFTDAGNQAMATRVVEALVADPQTLQLIQARRR